MGSSYDTASINSLRSENGIGYNSEERMLFAIRFLVFGCVVLTSVVAGAQTPRPTATPDDEGEVIRVDTQLIAVPVAVATGANAVRGLKASNFIIYEDGKRQEIADFSATAEPFEIALLLDTSGSARNELQLIKNAAKIFINSLRPGDRISIIAFDTDRSDAKPFAMGDVVIPLSSDRRALSDAVERLSLIHISEPTRPY